MADAAREKREMAEHFERLLAQVSPLRSCNSCARVLRPRAALMSRRIGARWPDAHPVRLPRTCAEADATQARADGERAAGAAAASAAAPLQAELSALAEAAERYRAERDYLHASAGAAAAERAALSAALDEARSHNARRRFDDDDDGGSSEAGAPRRGASARLAAARRAREAEREAEHEAERDAGERALASATSEARHCRERAETLEAERDEARAEARRWEARARAHASAAGDGPARVAAIDSAAAAAELTTAERAALRDALSEARDELYRLRKAHDGALRRLTEQSSLLNAARAEQSTQQRRAATPPSPTALVGAPVGRFIAAAPHGEHVPTAVVCARLETALFELQDAAAAAAADARRGRWDDGSGVATSAAPPVCAGEARGESLAREALARARAALVELDGARAGGAASPGAAEELARAVTEIKAFALQIIVAAAAATRAAEAAEARATGAAAAASAAESQADVERRRAPQQQQQAAGGAPATWRAGVDDMGGSARGMPYGDPYGGVSYGNQAAVPLQRAASAGSWRRADAATSPVPDDGFGGRGRSRTPSPPQPVPWRPGGPPARAASPPRAVSPPPAASSRFRSRSASPAPPAGAAAAPRVSAQYFAQHYASYYGGAGTAVGRGGPASRSPSPSADRLEAGATSRAAAMRRRASSAQAWRGGGGGGMQGGDDAGSDFAIDSDEGLEEDERAMQIAAHVRSSMPALPSARRSVAPAAARMSARVAALPRAASSYAVAARASVASRDGSRGRPAWDTSTAPPAPAARLSNSERLLRHSRASRARTSVAAAPGR